MRRSIISALMVVLFALSAYAAEKKVTDIPETDKKAILDYLHNHKSCQGESFQFVVSKEKIGPKKSGYLGSCTFGGGITVLFEKKQMDYKDCWRWKWT